MDNPRKAKGTEDLKAKALELTGLISYQRGAIVSREILRKKTGTVTVFAFDKDEELSEHTAPFDALVLGIDGQADITISGKVHRLGAGEMILMPAGEPHALRAVGEFKMVLIMIRS
jgi:quercetin dioxygenase-like cupin family protein